MWIETNDQAFVLWLSRRGPSVAPRCAILTAVTLIWRDELQGTVTMNLVVPMLETSNPFTCFLEATKGLVGKARVILQCLEQRLGVGVVVADRGSTEGWHDTQSL